MIRHIVLFTLTEKARQEGLESVVEKIRHSAENMTGKIPGLLTVELSLNRAKNSPHDLVFYSEFEDIKSLEAYQTHPLHEAHKLFASEYVGNPETADPF